MKLSFHSRGQQLQTFSATLSGQNEEQRSINDKDSIQPFIQQPETLVDIKVVQFVVIIH